MPARAKPRSAKKAARKKKAGAHKKAGSKKKGNKKAARRKAERKQNAARRKTSRASKPRSRVSTETSAKPKRQRVLRRAVRPPERVGFVREDSAGDAEVLIEVERGEVQQGDAIHVLGPESDFYLRIEQLNVDGKRVTRVRAGQCMSLRISPAVRANDAVHLLSR